MQQIVLGAIIAFFITFYAIPIIMRVADMKKLYDVPDARKLHNQPISSLGGFGIFVGFAITLLLLLNFTQHGALQYYMAAFLIIFFLGIKDDILVLSPQKKFLGQLLVAVILMFKGKLFITGMHGFFGVQNIDPMFQYFLSLFTIILIVNAFNLIDGVDGLAGTVGLITASIFGTLFLLNKDFVHAVIGFAMAGSILAFLIYNYYPAKVFMGDTGAMLIGVVNAILAIRFIELAPGFGSIALSATPAIGFGILLLPLMDTLRVFSIRIAHGRSPFSPDRNHIHHLLLDRGMNHRKVTLTLAGASIGFTAIAFLCQPLGTTYMVFILASLFLLGILGLYLSKPKVRLHAIKSDDTASANVRLLAIYQDPAPMVLEEE